MLPAYLEYWGLNDAPFSLAPNPRMFYLSDQHRECLMRLKFAIHSGKGGALLISENAGNGKTTTLNLLMRELSQDEGGRYRIAYLDYPTMTPEQMIGEISRQLGVGNVKGDKVEDMNALRDLLRSNHARGLHSLVIVDEGQMMADRPELLQEFRILLNCCSSGEFLLSFILSGQAPLEPAVRALPEFWQRLPVRFFLKDLHQADTAGMIHHRLGVAGATRTIFTQTAIEGVYRYSKGCPRVICAVADLALVVGHSNQSRQVDFAEVGQACSDMEHSGGSYHYFNFLEGEEARRPTAPGAPAAPPAPAPPSAPPFQAPVTPAMPLSGAPANSSPSFAPPQPAAAPMEPPPWMGGGNVAPAAQGGAVAAPVDMPAPTVAPAPPASPVPPAPPVGRETPPMMPAAAPVPPAPSPEPAFMPADPSPSAQPDDVCAACGTHCVPGTEICPKCAAILKVACGKCGSLQAARSKACRYCGFPLHAWAKEAEREFLAGLKRLNQFKTPEENEAIKFSHYRTLDGRVLYYAGAAGIMRQGAKVREVKNGNSGRLKGCGVIIGNRRLVLLEGKRVRDIPLSALSGCEVLADGKEQGGLVVRYRDAAYEIHFPVREARRAGFYRLVQAYLNRMRDVDG